ncbi:hypothetical protein JCM6882_006445 [Rhodosporidiobolus microsporus]
MSAQPIASTSSSVHRKPRQDTRDSDDSDALLEELEEELDNDLDIGGFREKRMMELKAQLDAAQRQQQTGYGKYSEYKVEKDLIQTTAKAKRSVVHFFHRDFRRCKIMDAHLEKLAAKHVDVLFVKADVANVPFLVTKLEVKVLPCVIGFVDGVSKFKLVGFEELEGGDNFNTSSLEIGMIQCGVLTKSPGSTTFGKISSFSATQRNSAASRNKLRARRTTGDSDSDWDD